MVEENAPSLRKSAKNALEITADSPTLKALAQTIGVSLAGPVGDILVQWGLGRGEQFAKERLEDWLVRLAGELETLQGEAVKKDFFATPKGYDLLLKALDEARRTRSEEKRLLYAKILRGAVMDHEREKYAAEEYLHLIADLTPLELRVARNRYGSDLHESGGVFSEDEEWRAWREQTCSRLKIDEATLSMSLSRIAATGLLEPVTSGNDQSGDWQWQGKPGDPSYYRVTPAFEKLMEFLELDA